MKPKPSFKVEQDFRLFFVFMTLVMLGVYVLSLVQQPGLRQPVISIPFFVLLAVHITLHWMVVPIIQTPNRKLMYILGQGLLAFAITQISQNTGMVFALYMALIGETIGFLGLNRWSALSTFYYLALSLTNFVIFTNLDSAFYWLLTIIPTVIFIGMYVTMYLRQADAREQAQKLAAELESANRQLTEYAARVEDLTIATERQRMARELHDTLSQGLAGIILQLEAVEAHLASNRPEKAQSIIANAKEQARATLSDARAAIDDLRKPVLDNLDSALRLEISRFTDATGLPCLFHADQIAPLPAPVTETLTRAVTESLANIARHAQANKVEINMQANASTLQLTIKDDGQGFDPEAIPSGHYGLLGLRERLRLHNGQLTIDSAPQKGTILTIEIPL